ncbi:MmyB family transcriptional regulator [Delftia sp. CH05]|uniref:MmyB family transcriptional regulator n=1 Tax=Delftia sp. CH05 TaxID=2692194 RepID=UPI00135DD9D7|nr:helix-turn-helix domain-containing protein [Delftia sp. CH05]MXN28835.1 helix-turn-helix domain-containing protein [Delftia sp. CH05]
MTLPLFASSLELGRFLRAKREALTPEDVGLASGRRRRVSGLRRTEVAERAAVGIDWYIALEQGRDVRASEHVLASLAKALLLSPAERDHLYALAGRSPAMRQPQYTSQVPATILRIIDKMEPDPAYVLDAAWDVLASNRSAAQLWCLNEEHPNYPRNLLWTTFVTRPRPDDEHWLHLTDYFLRAFRRQAAAYPEQARIGRLVADLECHSERFRHLWGQPEVRDTRGGRKNLIHPVEGLKTYDFTALAIPDLPGAHLFAYMDA